MENYQPIENYGVIGDMNTIALVGLNGSIDFMCFPRFDSPSIFCGLLDYRKGGKFSITCEDEDAKHRQMYIPDTNVLLTRFLSTNGVGEITDFMPVEILGKGNVLIRRIKSVRGKMTYRMVCAPRFNYARDPHTITQVSRHEVLFESKSLSLKLKSTVKLKISGDDATAEFALEPNETADFILEEKEKQPSGKDLNEFAHECLTETLNFWRNWIGRSEYRGRWSEIVNRSALFLKLCTSHKYGSIVAAPTFGLPERIGGSKNWDYRYTWIRDAAFTLYALIRLGYTRESGAFMHWLAHSCEDIGPSGTLNLMYAIDGSKNLEESTLDHLEGYKGSSPVRIGNEAYKQTQLDIYGELMDSIYLYNKYGEPISYDFWMNITQQINWLCDHWKEGDHGIWEIRGEKKSFLYSRVMCWVAVDRAVRLAEKRSFPQNSRWQRVRDEIYFSIFKDFWDDERKAFMQFKGSKSLDASSLLMPLIKFISPQDPRWLSTLKAIEEDLVSDSLVYRYTQEQEALFGLKGNGEGTFSLCSFWYVECLSRAGYLQKARFYFEKMIGYSNHLGLFSEQLGFRGEHLGNFPQAFTHLGLISSAYNLNLRLNDRRNREVNDGF